MAGGRKRREYQSSREKVVGPRHRWHRDRKEGVPILFISLPFLQQVQFTLRDSILRAMARPGCREKLTEGPRAIAKVWSCTDASPVLVDGPPKEPLPANDNPGWSVDCRIIRPDDDGLQRSSWKLGLARPCCLRPSRAYCLGGRGGEFCFTLLLGASRAASLQGVQTPERLVGGTMGN